MTTPTPESVKALADLADRVEAAAGPDRELDAAIDRLFNNRPNDGDYDESEGAFWRISEPWCGLLERPNGFARGSFCAARYTASLDAATKLTPVEDRWFTRLAMEDRHSHSWRWELRGGFGWDAVARAATPALALTAAALRAHAHLGASHA